MFKKAIVFTCVFLGSLASANPFPQMAKSSVDEIWSGLERCGLTVLNAYHPSLPRPQTPADLAIVAPNGRLLAYYLERYGAGASATFKNPNGGMVHYVAYSREHIKYLTPLAGTIAHGNRYMTINGPGYNLYCQSRPASPLQFQQCTQALFVNVVVNQLCRFGGR